MSNYYSFIRTGLRAVCVGILSGISLVLVLTGQLQAQDERLEEELRHLFFLDSFEPVETADGFVASYELRIEQPIDHFNPERGSFLQRVFLNHRGFDRPVVMITNG